jgi:hypothetical protein
MYAENDLLGIKICIRTCLGIDYTKAKIVRILDTLHMDEIEVSEGYLELIKENPEIEIVEGPYELEFDIEGFLI